MSVPKGVASQTTPSCVIQPASGTLLVYRQIVFILKDGLATDTASMKNNLPKRIPVMKNLIIFIVLTAGAYYAYQYFAQPKGLFDESGKPLSILFMYDDCGAPCNEAVTMLKRRGIDYEQINMNSGPEAETRLRSMGGSSTMPQLYAGTRRVDGFNRLRFTEALGETYGLNIVSGSTREAFESHFHSDGSPKLVMYGASWCPYCKKAREHFQENNLEFKEWDVEQESKGRRYFKTLEGNGYPLIYVGFRRVNTDSVKKALKEHPSLNSLQ